MSAFRIGAFAGMIPRTSPRLLANTQAQVATNARLTAGELLPLHDTLLRNIPGVTGIKTLHRIVDTSGIEYWLAWAADVDVALGPVAGDTSFRRYFTGVNEPRVTNLALASAGSPLPNGWFVLGVFPPADAPSVSHDGVGGGAAISRSMVYTFVTPWGEESQPSPSSAIVSGLITGTWTVSGMDVAPLNSINVTGSSWAGGIATLAVASTFGLRVGEEIKVTGMNPAGFNTGSSIITALDATHVSYAVAVNPGAFVAGGAVGRISPHNTTGMTKRIYWTETTVSGTRFQFVKEIPVATTSTTIAGNTISAEVLPSVDWPMPPVTLRGLRLHPSGAMVGFSGNTLYFSDIDKPYAYPTEFALSLDYNIVGIEVYGTSVMVATEGRPYVVSGASPDVMLPDRLPQPWPCLAKRGIALTPFGVVYPAPQGGVLIDSAGNATLLTDSLFKQEEWKALNPSSFIAAAYAGKYIASYDPVGNGNRIILMIDKLEYASVLGANKNCTAMYGDVNTGSLFVVIGDQIFEWDSLSASFIIYDWMSKEFVLPKPENLGAAKLDCDFTLTAEEIAAISAARAAVLATNQAIVTAGTYEAAMAESEVGGLETGGVDLNDLPLPPADSLQFQLWVNNRLRFTKTLTGSKAFKLPDGYKADAFAVRITGTVRVKGAVIASTMKELEKA